MFARALRFRKSKTLNCKHDQRIADRPTAGIEALPHYHQLLVPGLNTFFSRKWLTHTLMGYFT